MFEIRERCHSSCVLCPGSGIGTHVALLQAWGSVLPFLLWVGFWQGPRKRVTAGSLNQWRESGARVCLACRRLLPGRDRRAFHRDVLCLGEALASKLQLGCPSWLLARVGDSRPHRAASCPHHSLTPGLLAVSRPSSPRHPHQFLPSSQLSLLLALLPETQS